MYAKVFAQILDSSIADDYELRHFFTDLLILADLNGVVDMTPTAIAARTRIPHDKVVGFIARLAAPDLESRTPEHEGRRIILLDKHRSWGWLIVNYAKFRQIASEEQRREKTAARMRKLRAKDGATEEKATCDAPVTHSDACDAMQKQRHTQIQKQKHLDKGEVEPKTKFEAYERVKRALNVMFDRPETKELNQPEQQALVGLMKQPEFNDELEILKAAHRMGCQFLSTSIPTLLEKWNQNIDTARKNEKRIPNSRPSGGGSNRQTPAEERNSFIAGAGDGSFERVLAKRGLLTNQPAPAQNPVAKEVAGDGSDKPGSPESGG